MPRALHALFRGAAEGEEHASGAVLGGELKQALALLAQAPNLQLELLHVLLLSLPSLARVQSVPFPVARLAVGRRHPLALAARAVVVITSPSLVRGPATFTGPARVLVF